MAGHGLAHGIESNGTLLGADSMATPHRRTATRVRDGRVQKKQNWAPDRQDYLALPQDEIRIYRRDPGKGYRHLVTVEQLRAFLDMLPDWEEAAIGVDAIVLNA